MHSSYDFLAYFFMSVPQMFLIFFFVMQLRGAFNKKKFRRLNFLEVCILSFSICLIYFATYATTNAAFQVVAPYVLILSSTLYLDRRVNRKESSVISTIASTMTTVIMLTVFDFSSAIVFMSIDSGYLTKPFIERWYGLWLVEIPIVFLIGLFLYKKQIYFGKSDRK